MFMASLYYKFNAARGTWVSDLEKQSRDERLFDCRREHGEGCTRSDCVASRNYEHPKPAHRPPNGHVWDAANGVWLPDPSKSTARRAAAASAAATFPRSQRR